jgi:DNA-binding protein HU-beta
VQYLAHWLTVLKADERAIFMAASKAAEATAYLHNDGCWHRVMGEAAGSLRVRRSEPATRCRVLAPSGQGPAIRVDDVIQPQLKGPTMAKMTKTQLIDAISESSAVSKSDVKAVIEHMATVGYKELNESGEFVVPGFVKMSVVNKPATEARSGINPFTKEPMDFAAKPASKTVKASPLKVAKDAV